MLHSRFDPPPHAADLTRVERTQLLDRLDRAPASSVVWVQAPAGYGKTTLLAQWAARSSMPVAWLTLDTATNAPDRFAATIAAAIVQLAPQAEPLDSLGAADSPALLESIDRAMEIAGQLDTPVALVLDSLETLLDPALVAAVARLVEQRPANLRILLASRRRLELPLARWRAQEQLVDIDASQLALTPGEIATALERTLDPKIAARFSIPIANLTEGWAAGVGLGRRSLQRAAAAGTTPSMSELENALTHDSSEFLIDEVLSQQPPALVDFLLHTSILGRLTAAACAEIFGFSWSRKWLMELEQAGLFLTRTDGDPPVWRYHALFASALREAFEVRAGADAVAAAHLAASDWFARNNQLESALHHALRARDNERARGLAVASAPALLQSGEIGSLANLLGTMTAAPTEDASELLFWRCFVRMRTGDYETLSTELPMLESAWASSTDPLLLTRLSSLRATQLAYSGAHAAALRAADRALEQGAGLPTAELSLARVTRMTALVVAGDIAGADRQLREITSVDPGGDLTLRFYAAVIAMAQCEAHTAASILRQALDQFSAHMSHAYITCLLTLIDITRNWGDVAGAYELMKQADAYECTLPHRMLRWEIECSWSQLRAADGNWGDAYRHAIAMLHAVPIRCSAEKQRFASIWFAWTAAQQGDSGPMHAVLDSYSSPPERSMWEVRCGLFVAAMQSTVGDDDAALHLLSGLRMRATSDGRFYDVFRSSILEAVIHEHTNDREAALISLQRAIPLARRSGFRQPFQRHGGTIHTLLRALPHNQGARQLLDWMSEDGTIRVDVLATAPTGVEPLQTLTPREAQILGLVDLGLSNEEIGSALGISVPTVKRHLTNLFGKLGARNRTEATYQLRRRNLVHEFN